MSLALSSSISATQVQTTAVSYMTTRIHKSHLTYRRILWFRYLLHHHLLCHSRMHTLCHGAVHARHAGLHMWNGNAGSSCLLAFFRRWLLLLWWLMMHHVLWLLHGGKGCRVREIQYSLVSCRLETDDGQRPRGCSITLREEIDTSFGRWLQAQKSCDRMAKRT